jgi:hypothetical protein
MISTSNHKQEAFVPNRNMSNLASTKYFRHRSLELRNQPRSLTATSSTNENHTLNPKKQKIELAQNHSFWTALFK